MIVVANPPWGPCRLPAELRVLASSETAPLIETVADGFADERLDWRGCRAVHVSVNAPRSAADLRTWLSEGWDGEVAGPTPDLWVADSLAEITEVGAKTGGELTLGGNPEVVASSPLVLALPEADAVNLAGVTDRSWLNVLRKSLTQRVLRTHPRTSNVGLLSTVGLYEGRLDDRGLPERQYVESRVSTEVGWFDDAYDLMCREAGVGSPAAVYLTEQQLYDFNQARAGKPGGVWEPADCSRAVTLPGGGGLPPLHPLYLEGGPSMVHRCVPTTWASRRTAETVPALARAFCAALKRELPRLGLRSAEGRLSVTDEAKVLKRTPVGNHRWPERLAPTRRRRRCRRRSTTSPWRWTCRVP